MNYLTYAGFGPLGSFLSWWRKQCCNAIFPTIPWLEMGGSSAIFVILSFGLALCSVGREVHMHVTFGIRDCGGSKVEKDISGGCSVTTWWRRPAYKHIWSCIFVGNWVWFVMLVEWWVGHRTGLLSFCSSIINKWKLVFWVCYVFVKFWNDFNFYYCFLMRHPYKYLNLMIIQCVICHLLHGEWTHWQSPQPHYILCTVSSSNFLELLRFKGCAFVWIWRGVEKVKSRMKSFAGYNILVSNHGWICGHHWETCRPFGWHGYYIEKIVLLTWVQKLSFDGYKFII